MKNHRPSFFHDYCKISMKICSTTERTFSDRDRGDRGSGQHSEHVECGAHQSHQAVDSLAPCAYEPPVGRHDRSNAHRPPRRTNDVATALPPSAGRRSGPDGPVPNAASFSAIPAPLWMLAAALTGWSFGYTRLKGSDLWWHLAAGRWMTDHRALPAGDPWSFTAAGSAWLNHEWLSDVVFDLWSRVFGQAALVCWKWAVLAATVVLLLSALRRLTGEWLGS